MRQCASNFTTVILTDYLVISSPCQEYHIMLWMVWYRLRYLTEPAKKPSCLFRASLLYRDKDTGNLYRSDKYYLR
jgi:hypothetical protein